MSGRDLSPEERIISAYLHNVCKVEQQHLCIAFNVNIGRVNEACMALGMAAADPKRMRKRMERPLPEEEKDQ